MSIETNSVRIETYRDNEHNGAIARVDQTMSGCAMQIRLVNCGEKCGVFWLCHRQDDERNDYILMLPSPKWENDARDAGFELVQKLSARSPKTGKGETS
jgi:hypothetical protein